MQIRDDNTLVRDVIEGNVDVFRELVERHQARIYYLGLKFFHKPEDAEDFAQDVFLQVFEKLHMFNGSVPFGAWLYRVAYNLAVNKYHVKRRKMKEVDTEKMVLTDETLTPDQAIVETELTKGIQKILKELPDSYQMVVKMHFYDDLSYPQIGEATGLPVNTIKSHIFRAKDIIKKKLGKKMK